jgi:hypothetical protein
VSWALFTNSVKTICAILVFMTKNRIKRGYLSKITWILSNRNRHKISKSIFENSTKFWFKCIDQGSAWDGTISSHPIPSHGTFFRNSYPMGWDGNFWKSSHPMGRHCFWISHPIPSHGKKVSVKILDLLRKE